MECRLAASTDTRSQLHGLRGLLDAVEDFVSELEASRLPPTLAGELPLVLRVSNYLEDVVGLVQGLDLRRADLDAVNRPPAQDTIAGFQAAVVAQVARCDVAAQDFDSAALDGGFVELEARWHELKSVLLDAASRRALPLAPINGALEGLRSALRMAEQLSKAARRLHALNPAAEPAPPATDDAGEATATSVRQPAPPAC